MSTVETRNGRPRGRTAPPTPTAPRTASLDLFAMLETEEARERALSDALARQQGRVELLREQIALLNRPITPTAPETQPHAPSPDPAGPDRPDADPGPDAY